MNNLQNKKWGKLNKNCCGSILSINEQNVINFTDKPFIKHIKSNTVEINNLILKNHKGKPEIGQLTYKDDKLKYYGNSGWIIINETNIISVGSGIPLIFNEKDRYELKSLKGSENINLFNNSGEINISILKKPEFDQIKIKEQPINDNDIIRLLDLKNALLGLSWQPSVSNITNIPGDKIKGKRYLIDTNPINEWVNYSNYIAEWDGINWIFIQPKDTWSITVQNNNHKYTYNSTYEKWIDLGTLEKHNVLNDIQGGKINEYYHLSQIEYYNLINQHQHLNISGSPTFNSINISNNIDTYNLNISGNINIYKNLNISGDINISQDLNVSGHTHISQNLNIFKDLNVSGNTNISKNLNIFKDLNVSGKIYGSNAEFQSLFVNNTLSFTNLSIAKNLNVSGNLNVCSGSFNDLYIKNNIVPFIPNLIHPQQILYGKEEESIENEKLIIFKTEFTDIPSIQLIPISNNDFYVSRINSISNLSATISFLNITNPNSNITPSFTWIAIGQA